MAIHLSGALENDENWVNVKKGVEEVVRRESPDDVMDWTITLRPAALGDAVFQAGPAGPETLALDLNLTRRAFTLPVPREWATRYPLSEAAVRVFEIICVATP